MKRLVIALLGLFVATAQAEETKYTLEMSGVTWGGCKAYVRGALEKAFDATNIVITAGAKPKTQKVTFSSKNKKISKRQAVNSMGDKKKRFVVKELWRPTAPDEWKREPREGLEPDGKWHLLLLRPSNALRV